MESNVGHQAWKRRRTDSGFEEFDQSSRATSLGTVKRQDSDWTQSSSGKRACSPILLSDELELEVTDEAPVDLSEPSITIYLGSQKQNVPQSRFLSHAWRYGLDSPCMVCGREFGLEVLDPPIRTISFETSETIAEDTEDITRAPVAPHPLRVFNRHMGCIKSKRISYIPVSHVWHHAVSVSQNTHVKDLGAARLAYQVPVQSLLALTKKFGPVEIWHDYLSVPQWHAELQRQLLLHIPSIYAYPEQMVMHLHDVQAASLTYVEQPSSYGAFLAAIAKLTNSRWFERMWVALEYIQSQDVLIMTQYYDICDTTAAELSKAAGFNIGMYLKRLRSDRFNEIAKAKGFSWEKRASWDDMQTWKTLDRKYRTLGGAIFILGQKQCRDHHDLFFALRGLLDLGQDKTEVKTILADDTFESYKDLIWRALQKGDYSPLLFIPQQSEKPDERAPWLRGHSKMTQKLWDLGVCRRAPRHSNIIQDDVIKPKLECIGVVDSFKFEDFLGSPEEVLKSVCLTILPSIVDKGEGISDELCETIYRVFPSASSKGIFRSSTETETTTSEDSRHILIDEMSRIDELRRRIVGLPPYDTKCTHKDRLEASKKLVSILGLGLPEDQSHVSRIKAAADEAAFYGKNREGLAWVRCKGCLNTFVHRVTAWKSLEPGETKDDVVELYRIPGLLFDDTVPEGVGIAVAGGTIVGRTSYATHTCACRISEYVELGRK